MHVHNPRGRDVHDDARVSSILVRDDDYVPYFYSFVVPFEFGCKNAANLLQLGCKVTMG